jgi:hypothetical protein
MLKFAIISIKKIPIRLILARKTETVHNGWTVWNYNVETIIDIYLRKRTETFSCEYCIHTYMCIHIIKSLHKKEWICNYPLFLKNGAFFPFGRALPPFPYRWKKTLDSQNSRPRLNVYPFVVEVFRIHFWD